MLTIEEMKEQIKEFTKRQKEQFTEVEEPWNTITLYHGTTTKYLNDIIQKGITPRKVNQVNNFSEVPSNEELVYLTTKWHYWYAYNANQESLIKAVGKERFENESISTLWKETSDIPMYVVCEVPIELLTLDEDVVYQSSIRKELKEGTITSPEDISVERCLQQGTVASLKEISPEYINEIVIIGNEDYREYLLEGQYGMDASRWFRGFGLGDADMFELSCLELTKYKIGNGVIEVQYPVDNNLPIKNLQLNENGLSIIR